jgi:radical SAM superfamily enzyme YgiQ (UPF0313 family)
MKVLLVNPPLSAQELKNPVIANLFSNAMPLGIAFIAAVLQKEGIHVRMVDGAAERKSPEDILRIIEEEESGLVGITSTSVGFHRAREIASLIKRKLSDKVVTVLGGPHITALPHYSMEFPEFDIGVIGEGEVTSLELVRALEKGTDLNEVAGIAYRKDGEAIFTAPRDLIPDLDVLPFPARHLLDTRLYASLPTDVKYLPKFTQLPTRGCPFSCKFCDSAVVGKKYRTPSPEYMVREMEHLKGDFGAREIAFVGTTFTAKRESTERFVDILIEKKLGIAWTCSTRVDVLDKDLLKKMKAAGCWSIRLGIESGNDEVLKFIRKGTSRDQVARAVRWCDEVGIHTKGFFMIGHLIDTRKTIEETIDFACSLPLTDITVQINTPLPNTAQYDEAEQYGTFRKEDFSRFSFFDVVFVPKGMTEDELLRLHRRFYNRFYWRVPTLLRQIRKAANFNTFRNYLKCLDLILYLTVMGPGGRRK